MGDGWPRVLLGHDPPARGEPRLRLVAARRVRRDGRRRPPRCSPRSTSAARAASRSPATIGVVASTAVALVVSVVRRRGGVRGREALRADRRARVAAMVGREATGDARPRAASRVPAGARPDRAGPRRARAARRRAVRGRAVPARRAPAARRRGVPRVGLRRDAARPLVPRAARSATRAGEGARALVRGRVAVRDRWCSSGRPAWCRCSTAS